MQVEESNNSAVNSQRGGNDISNDPEQVMDENGTRDSHAEECFVCGDGGGKSTVFLMTGTFLQISNISCMQTPWKT